MIRHVVDASVTIKWFVDEVHAESARHLLADEYALYAPYLVWVADLPDTPSTGVIS